jgi:hypothetical protein
MRLIEVNAKGRPLKKLTCKRTWRQVFIRLYRLEVANFLRTFSHVGILTQLCDLYSPLLPLSLSLWFNSPPPPSLYE